MLDRVKCAPPLVHVDMDPLEWAYACYAGFLKKTYFNLIGLKERDGADPDATWDNMIRGTAAEPAVAKWAGVYWAPRIGKAGDPDVVIDGVGCQVRSKKTEDMFMCVKADAVDEEPYISVWVQPAIRRCSLAGWIYAGAAKRPSWLKHFDRPDGRHDLKPKASMYAVPREFFEPMDALRIAMKNGFM